jgi:hypothetical protein
VTARWDPTLDASDIRAEAADDALEELYAGRSDWPEDNTPTKAELDRDEWDTK